MIKRQLNPLRIGKGLLCLLALFMMLLTPQVAWAQTDYGLTVAGVAVTSENASAITGQFITSSEGSVKYDYDTKTLTLTSATIEGSIVRTSNENLTIHFIGSNTINTSNAAAIFVYNGTSQSATLSFTQSGDGVSLTVNDMADSDKMTSGWATSPKIWKSCAETHAYPADQCDWMTTLCSDYIMLAPNYKYDLWVNGSQMCDAEYEIDYSPNDYDHDNSIYFNRSYNELTFCNVDIETTNSPFIVNGVGDLTIKLQGENTVSCGQLFLGKKTGDTDHKVTFMTTNDMAGTLVVTTTGGKSDAWYTGHDAPTVTGLVLTDEMKNNVRTLTFSEPTSYNLTVANIPVTSGNASGITGDYITGTVTFDAENNTLTLNNAIINGRIFSELQGGLTVHLLGNNVIDGGYVENNSDQPGDKAFVTEGENVALTFTTDETAPGQLLMKNTARDGEVPMYYQGFANPSFGNGLSTALNDNKCLIAKAPVVEPGEGIHWTDQTYTISGLEGATIKYKDYLGKISETTYNEPFGIQNTGKYYLGIWQTLTVAETEFDLYSNNVNYIVHNKPTFSLSTENVYESPAELKLENLPTDLATTIDTYPQVWYYFGENVEDSVQYISAEQTIAVSESTKVCVYILDEDSDKIYKSKTVEAEYDVRASAGLSYIDTQTAKPVELVQYTIGGEDNPTLPMLTNESELPVSFSSSETDVATIDEEGNVTIVGVGLTRITATTEMTEDYVPGEATYDLKVYKDLSHESIQVTVEDVVFDGESKTPADFITVTDGNYELTYNEDYRISSPEGLVTNVGSYTITIEGDLDDSYYVGSKQVTFKIVNRTLADNEVTFYNNWATFYSNDGVVMLPSGIGAYVAKSVDDKVVTVSQISYIPEKIPVLLNNETTTTTENTSVTDNLLVHASTDIPVSQLTGDIYGLYNGTFMRVTGTITADKNFLQYPAATIVNPGAPQLTIVIDCETTGVNDVRRKKEDVRGDIYDLQGRKVQKLSKKGLYIQKGHKVVVNK